MSIVVTSVLITADKEVIFNNILMFLTKISNNSKERMIFSSYNKIDSNVMEGYGMLYTTPEKMGIKSSDIMRYLEALAAADLSTHDVIIARGGSDSFSGIMANPLVGRLSDKLISYGGSCVLTEVPEMFGAEHLLMQ